MKQAVAVIGIMITVSSAICKESNKQILVGRWEPLTVLNKIDDQTAFYDEVTLVFHKDGTVSAMEEGKAIPGAKYKLKGVNKVEMSFFDGGTISGMISASGDEISFTTLSGQVDKYGKVTRIEKITKSAVAGDYISITKTPEKQFTDPGIISLRQDGTATYSLYGQWQALEELDLLPTLSHGRLNAGKIKADMLYQDPPGTSLKKQEGAVAIAKLAGGNVLWSKYQGSFGPSDKITITLDIEEDGTFKQILLSKDTWRIRDGIVEITMLGKNQKWTPVKGELGQSGYAIIFRKDDGIELRYMRRSKQYLPILAKFGREQSL